MTEPKYSPSTTTRTTDAAGKIKTVTLRLPAGQLTKACQVWNAVLDDPATAARILPRQAHRDQLREATALCETAVEPYKESVGLVGRPPPVEVVLTRVRADRLRHALNCVMGDRHASHFVLPEPRHKVQARKVLALLDAALDTAHNPSMFPKGNVYNTRRKSARLARLAQRRARGGRFKR